MSLYTISTHEGFDFSRLERACAPEFRHPYLLSISAALTPEEAARVQLLERSYTLLSHQFPSGYTPEEYLILLSAAKRVHVAAQIYLAEWSLLEADPQCFNKVFCHLTLQAGRGLLLPLIQTTNEDNYPLINKTILSTDKRVKSQTLKIFESLLGYFHAAT